MPTLGRRERPFFSVLIPSYNRPEFVGAAVRSVLASDFKDCEVIVSDDCSPRQSEIAAVLEEYLSDPRVQFHAQPRNLREPVNRAFLLEVARGDWQVTLSDDDKLYPTALRVLAAAIQANPGVDLFTFGYTLIDEHDRPKYSRRAPRPLRIHRDDTRVLQEFLVSDCFPYWFYQPATFCCHRRVRERITPNPTIGMGDDIQYLFDYVNDGGTMLVLPEVLMCYRKMDSRASHLQLNQSGARLANLYTRYRIMLDLQRRADVCPQFRNIVADAEFRRRFVYNSVFFEDGAPETIADEIGMETRHREELADYYKRRTRVWVKAGGYMARCRFFVGLFGLAGAAEILRVATQRCAFRVSPQRWLPHSASA